MPLGEVDRYMLDSLRPETGTVLTCSELFKDYAHWCSKQDLVPLRESVFMATFEALAREAGIVARQRGGNLMFLDTGLAPVSGQSSPHSAETAP